MFRIDRSRPWPPHLDLATARETIAYIEDDMRRVPELESVADALNRAITAIEDAEAKAPLGVPMKPFVSRFLPRR